MIDTANQLSSAKYIVIPCKEDYQYFLQLIGSMDIKPRVDNYRPFNQVIDEIFVELIGQIFQQAEISITNSIMKETLNIHTLSIDELITPQDFIDQLRMFKSTVALNIMQKIDYYKLLDGMALRNNFYLRAVNINVGYVLCNQDILPRQAGHGF